MWFYDFHPIFADGGKSLFLGNTRALLDCRRNLSIVNTINLSTTLPNIMGRDAEQEHDRRSSEVTSGKKIPTIVTKTRKEEYLFQANNNLQRRILQSLRRFNVYFRIRFGNPAICPNIEIHQPFQVGVRQAKTSKGAPTPAVLLGLGHSQTPLTQFSCSCILTFFFFFFFGWKSPLSVCKIYLSVRQSHMSYESTTGASRIFHVWMETGECSLATWRLIAPLNIPWRRDPAVAFSASLFCVSFRTFISKAFFFFFFLFISANIVVISR